MRGDNVFIYQNTIIHKKYLHINFCTSVEFLDQLIYVLFCPALDFCPRPVLLENALPIPGRNLAAHVSAEGRLQKTQL